MQTAHRSATVGLVLQENLAGWMASRYIDEECIERRMFRDEYEAEDWAAEWVESEFSV